MSEKTIKPTMTGDGLQTTHKNGDDLGIVCDIGYCMISHENPIIIPLNLTKHYKTIKKSIL